jgi:hypothetical protein
MADTGLVVILSVFELTPEDFVLVGEDAEPILEVLSVVAMS